MKESRRGRGARKEPSSASSQSKRLNGAEQQALLDQALAGSIEAHGLLLESCRPWMHRTFVRRLPERIASKVDANDLTQDACIQALAGFAGFAGQCLPQYCAWLRKICQNLLAAAIRAFSGTEHDVAREQPLEADSFEHGRGPRQPTPDEVLAALDDLALLAKALNDLPRDERQIVVWRQYEALTFIEIAARLCWTRHAVERAFQRAFVRLRVLIKQARC